MTKLDEMWAALAAYQPQADAAGHGEGWAKMCQLRTVASASASAAAAAADAYAAAYAAAAKVWARHAIDRISKVLKVTAPVVLAEQPAHQEPVVLREALAAALTDTYVCGRVWSAWGVGTMSQDDFIPASECDELLDELVSAATTAAPQPTQRKPLAEDVIMDLAKIQCGLEFSADDDILEDQQIESVIALARAIEAAHGIKEIT